MGIEGITGAVSNYQNTGTTGTRTQVASQSYATEAVSQGESQSTIAQEVLTVQGRTGAEEQGGGTKGEKQPSEDTVKQTLKDINKKLNNTECVWGVDDATDRITIKIVDKETKDVIKELPPEKTLEMIAKAWELAGILVDEKL